MNHDKISHTVEVICNQGCDSVNSTIEALQNGNKVKHTENLNPTEASAVLKELVEIMSVYKK